MSPWSVLEAGFRPRKAGRIFSASLPCGPCMCVGNGLLQCKRGGGGDVIFAPAVFAADDQVLSIKMSKIQRAGEGRWGAAIGAARKGGASVLVQNVFFNCNWLQFAASLCN